MPPHWVCLFWSGSLWQCQDSVSLVHCTAVTYLHSLTHIYSSSITGLDTLRPQLVPRKNGWKTKPRAPAGRLHSVLSGALWVIMWPLSPLQTLSHTYIREKMRTLHQGWGKVHCGLLFFLVGVARRDVLKTFDSCTHLFWRYMWEGVNLLPFSKSIINMGNVWVKVQVNVNSHLGKWWDYITDTVCFKHWDSIRD